MKYNKTILISAILFGIFILTLNGISAWTFFPYNTADAGTNVQYNISFSNSSTCITNGTIFSVGQVVAVASNGVGSMDVQIPSNLSQVPQYICVYKSNSLLEVDNMTDIIFNNIYANNLNLTGNVTANTGFFSFLGSLLRPIVNLFATNITTTNLNVTGLIFGNGSQITGLSINNSWNQSSLLGNFLFNITNQNFEIRNSSTSNIFFVNGTTGFIGINTTVPNQILTVAGNVNVTGNGTSPYVYFKGGGYMYDNGTALILGHS